MAHITFKHMPFTHPDEAGLTSDSLGVTLDLKRYGGKLSIEYSGDTPTTKIPLYAYIHGNIAFGLSKTCSWDSGRVGTLYVPKGVSPESILAMLDAYYNNDNYDDGEEFGGTMCECIDHATSQGHTYDFEY